MALLEKHRSVIYAHLVEHVGEEAAEAMLAQFPSRDLDEPVTKEFVALQIAELRTEMHQEFSLLRAEITQQLGEVRTDGHQQLGEFRTEINEQLGEFRTEINEQLGEFRTEINQKLTAQDDKIEALRSDVASMRGEMHQLTDRLMNRVQLMAGLLVVALTVVGVLTR